MADKTVPSAKPDEIRTHCARCGVGYKLSVADGIEFIAKYDLGPIPDCGGITVLFDPCHACGRDTQKLKANVRFYRHGEPICQAA